MSFKFEPKTNQYRVFDISVKTKVIIPTTEKYATPSLCHSLKIGKEFFIDLL